MSRETPGKHLARLKVTYAAWAIRHAAPGFEARHRDTRERVHGLTLGALEAALAAAEHRAGHDRA